MQRETASGMLLTLLIASMLFPAIGPVKGQTETHDLEVSLNTSSPLIIRGTYNHLSSGNSTILNATVVNRGIFNESNVALQLLLNGTVVLNAITPTLEVNHTFWTAYFWNPTDGDYNLTVYAPPVTDEGNAANNNVTRWVRVGPDQPPTASFTWSPPPPPPGPIQNRLVTFDASNSSDPDWGTILNYTWNFGDGNTTTVSQFNITHTYTAWGNLTVTLTLRDTENLTGSISNITAVYARPDASFVIPGSCFVNQTLTFNATSSSDPDNINATNKGIVSYNWDFGDGNSTSWPEPTINYTYVREGNYTVTLNVTDYDGLVSDSVSKTQRILSRQPVADFLLPQGPCYVYYPLVFDASASYDPDNQTAPNKGIASYTWDFNDGNTTTVSHSNITHWYQNTGEYNVNLTVTDFEGLSHSKNKTMSVSFEVFVKVVDSVNETTNIVHNPGDNFRINITITNVVDLFSYEINLTWPGDKYPILVASDPKSGDFLAPEDFESHFSSYQGFVSIKSSRVGVANGVSGNGTLATVQFHVNDTMTGKCTLNISLSLLWNSKSVSINNTPVHGYFYTTRPAANFTYTPHQPTANSTVTFDASASYDPDGGSIVSYEWNFDDGNDTTTSNSNITHSYNSVGTFNVNLTVTDDNGERWWINDTVEVVAGRDVAVIEIEPSMLQWNATLGLYETAGTLPTSVNVTNEGNADETFKVTLYFNDTSVEVVLVTNLSPGESRLVNFTRYNVKDLAKGVYNISAYAWPVPGETHTSDNTYTDGAVRVYLQGNINRDNSTDIYDAILLAKAYNSRPGDPNWNLNADLNCDGVVDLFDAILLASNFNKTDP